MKWQEFSSLGFFAIISLMSCLNRFCFSLIAPAISSGVLTGYLCFTKTCPFIFSTFPGRMFGFLIHRRFSGCSTDLTGGAFADILFRLIFRRLVVFLVLIFWFTYLIRSVQIVFCLIEKWMKL